MEDIRNQMNTNTIHSLEIRFLLNHFIDHYMPEMSSSEFKVYLYLYRQTLGAGTQMTELTLSQFIKGTGLTKNTVIKAMRTLEKQHLIFKVVKYSPYKYMLNYSTIIHGDGLKFEPNTILIKEMYMAITPITTGFPESW